MVELVNSRQVVVRTAISFDVDPHIFKHLPFVSISEELEHFCFVLLVEPCHWILLRRCFGVAEIWPVVGLLEQRNVVLIVEVKQTPVHILAGPLVIWEIDFARTFH